MRTRGISSTGGNFRFFQALALAQRGKQPSWGAFNTRSGLIARPTRRRMVLSSLQTNRTGNLSKDDNPDGGKSRAVRARQRAIGRELRRIYDGVVNEPVPDEFMDLLRRMDDGEGTAGGGKKSS